MTKSNQFGYIENNITKKQKKHKKSKNAKFYTKN